MPIPMKQRGISMPAATTAARHAGYRQPTDTSAVGGAAPSPGVGVGWRSPVEWAWHARPVNRGRRPQQPVGVTRGGSIDPGGESMSGAGVPQPGLAQPGMAPGPSPAIEALGNARRYFAAAQPPAPVSGPAGPLPHLAPSVGEAMVGTGPRDEDPYRRRY